MMMKALNQWKLIDWKESTKYLIDQVRLTEDARIDALKAYYPDARKEDWKLAVAGYRVQVIKKASQLGASSRIGDDLEYDGTVISHDM